MRNLSLFLRKANACYEWQVKANSLRSAESLFNEAWDELNDPLCKRHRPDLIWLADALEPVRTFDLCCHEGARIGLLGLPFSAWVEAAQAYMRANRL